MLHILVGSWIKIDELVGFGHGIWTKVGYKG